MPNMSEHYFPCGHKIVLGHTCPVCENKAILAALKAVEWPYEGRYACPCCGQHKGQGHALDCQLAKALKDAEGEQA